MKYGIRFIQGDDNVLLAEGLTDIQACQFAINLHQSSNVHHEIRVLCDDGCLLVLIKK